jgi:hypothetical protein
MTWLRGKSLDDPNPTATLELRTKYPRALDAIRHVKIHLHSVGHCSIGHPLLGLAAFFRDVHIMFCNFGTRFENRAACQSILGPLMLFSKLATKQLPRETYHDCTGGANARVTNCGLP